VILQAEEVSGSAWLPIEQIEPKIIREKMLPMRSTLIGLPLRGPVTLE
jgi:hypothetical protein